MPCQGPSDGDIRSMEREVNREKLGKGWSSAEFAENVACALTAHIRHNTAIPEWATKWMDQHEEYDRRRKQQEKNEREAAEQREYEQWVKLNRKFGKVK